MDKPQEQQPKRNDLKTLMVLGVVFLALTFGSVAGLCGGFFYYAFSEESIVPHWQTIPQPLEKITKLRGADFYTVYVETESGQLYSCYWVTPNANDCWNEIEELPELTPSFCNGGIPSQSIAPDPPPSELVMETQMFHYCSTWAGRPHLTTFEYFLMQNGELQRWGIDRFHIGPPPGMVEGLYLNMAIGCLAGIVIPIALGILLIQGLSRLMSKYRSRDGHA
ncbi:MAG: hypothetical protein KF770_25995 [Anaerolineae bacterium]|nr:hypothetical protein [Anaerolineae bacterium]